MMKVLIALDYDPTAQKVAELGFAFASAMKADITLLHIVSEPAYYSNTDYSPIMGYTGFMDVSPTLLNSVEGLKSTSLHFLENTKQLLGDKSIHTLVLDGDYAETILETAEAMHIDIIVMGSHGRKWLEKIIMGSVTEKVLGQTSIPLYIIPTKK